jgi:glutamyl/glutaminyl-tRNA synthetase
LLAALLCWLDARSQQALLRLRLEDLDPTRCTEASAREMRSALDWFGLDWDDELLQSESLESHRFALDTLARQGVLYPCSCSRREIERMGVPAADGGWRYPGTCRNRELPQAGWREVAGVIRLRLEPGRVEPHDEGALNLGQDPAAAMGDPVLRRRDGAIAYHLACVVDDGTQGVTRVIRGRDLATSTAIQVVLQRLLDLPTPAYRHHLLLLERRGAKLAKLHGAVGWRELEAHYAPEKLCGMLAMIAGLRSDPEPVRPSDLLRDFHWSRVGTEDRPLHWTGRELVLETGGASERLDGV